MNNFEQRLSECLEALIEGRLTVAECLEMYPEHADALRPHLIAATAFARTADQQPSADWSSRARERFLVASGKTLQDAMEIEPEPTFFAAARVRFLMAAQRLRQERVAQPTRTPFFGAPMRLVGAVAVTAAIFVGFSGWTVTSADAALPGDWRYPIKLQTERVRLAVALSDDQKRDVKFDIAEERLSEIEALASRGKIIGPGVLNRFVEQTEPLVAEASQGKLDDEDAARLQQVSIRSTQVLAQVKPQVADNATEKLAEAQGVTVAAANVTRELVVNNPNRPNIVITPQIAVPTDTPKPTDTSDPTQEPGAETPTPEATEVPPTEGPAETPTEPSVADAPSDAVLMSETPIVDLGEIKLHTLIAGRLTLRAPGPGTGWYLDAVPQSGVPLLITLKTQDQQSFMVLNTHTGDMYWYISAARNGRYDEVQMRMTRDGTVFMADALVLRYFYGNAAEVPLLVMNSIRLLPQPVSADGDAVPAP
jgi:hypothetical protein